MKEFRVATPEEFTPVIDEVLDRAKASSKDQAVVVTLLGDLGAGKTTFTSKLAKHLGVEELVVSPTFGIMKMYDLPHSPDFKQLVHIDAYRIESKSELEPLRFSELFTTPQTLVCIEWPEQMQSVIPDQVISLQLEIISQEERKVIVF